MISIQHLSFAYSVEKVVNDISLDIEMGSIAALLGPNGSGKSSLLKLLSGELQGQSGEIYFNGNTINSWPAADKAKVMAVLAQENILEFDFTVAEVVALSRIPHNTGNEVDQEIIHAALAAVDASHLAERFYPQLSGGEKQRVQLARVLAQIWQPSELGPRLLILDEPTASIDLAHQQLLKKIIQQYAANQVTVIMVLHDLNLAAQCADKIFFLQQGQIVAQGTPKQVLTKDIVDSVFGIEANIIDHPETGLPVIMP